jgi:high mobility group protein B1
MSKTWAKLNASTKKEWEDKASEDKTRYEREMAEYTPPVGGTYGKDGMSIVPLCKKEYPALKKPRSAYVIFFKEQRAKVRGRCKYPGL